MSFNYKIKHFMDFQNRRVEFFEAIQQYYNGGSKLQDLKPIALLAYALSRFLYLRQPEGERIGEFTYITSMDKSVDQMISRACQVFDVMTKYSEIVKANVLEALSRVIYKRLKGGMRGLD